MICYTDTTVFNVGAQTIVNTVNCVGVMGGGLALEFRLRFPDMYNDYVQRCTRKEVVIGKPYPYRVSSGLVILNFPTKKHWRYPSKLEWIDTGLRYFMSNYKQMGVTSIAFPPLGCSRGNLRWEDVEPLMEGYLGNLDLDIHICLDRESLATGIEGVMVSRINDRQDQTWIEQLELRRDIAESIVSSLPIRRFRDLRQIRGVGTKTYIKLFELFHASAKHPSESVGEMETTAKQAESKQLKLFDT